MRASVLRSLCLSRPLQWGLLLAAPAGLWLFWPEPERTPPVHSGPRLNKDGFLALEYDGVRRRTEGKAISRERFQDHLRALKGAGYEPITLEEARDFLLERAPLPEKAVLLVLDDGRRETVREAEKVLSPLRFPATLYLRPKPMETSSYRYPAWHDVRLLAATGRWSFPSKPEMALAPASSPLAFTAAGYALNHWGRPPDRLTRLLVDPEWMGEELVLRLDSQWVRRSAYPRPSSGDWVYRHGRLSVESSRIILEPEKARGAEAWLAGSEAWRSVHGEVTLENRPGAQAWLYLRGVPGESFLRIGWTGRRIEAQVRVPGSEVRTLASGLPAPGSSRSRIPFDLLERRIRFGVEGGASPPRAFPLPRELESGMAGLGVWLLGEECSPVAFEELRLEPRPARGVLVRDIADARAAGPEPIDVLAPLWYSASGDGEAARLIGHPDLALAHLAAYRGAALWPVVRLSLAFDDACLGALAREIERVASGPGVEGVLLDIRPARSAGIPLDPWRLAELLEETSARIGLLLDPALEDLEAFGRWERVARIASPEVTHSSAPLPSERLLLMRDLSR